MTQATCSLPDAPGVHSGLTWRNDAVNTRPPKAIGLQELRVLEDADFGGDWKCGFDLFGGVGGAETKQFQVPDARLPIFRGGDICVIKNDYY